MQLTIEQVAALAWNLVKDDADPEYANCHIDHRNRLVYEAQNVQASRLANSAFEQKVAEVLTDPGAALRELAARAAPSVVEEAAPEPTTPDVSVSENEPVKPKRATKPKGGK